MACASSPRPSLVTKLDPTLTTMRRALHSIWELSIAIYASSAYSISKFSYIYDSKSTGMPIFVFGKPRVAFFYGRLLCHLLRLDVRINGVDQ